MKNRSKLKVFIYDIKHNLISKPKIELFFNKEKITHKVVFSDRLKCFEIENLEPDFYKIEISATGLETQFREIEVKAGENKEVFILGKEGLPSYFRGKTKVPFEPFNNLIALSFPELTKDRMKNIQSYLKRYKVNIADRSTAFMESGVCILELPDSSNSERDTVAVISQLEGYSYIGKIVKLFENEISFLTNQLIIRFKSFVTSEQVKKFGKKFGLKMVRNIPYVSNGFLFEYKRYPNYEILELAERISGSPLIEYVEPNLVVTATDDFTPNDFLFNSQPHHQIINTENAWDINSGSNDITIAVVDSGFDLNHPDFVNPAAAGWNKVVNPFDFTGMDANPLNSTHGIRSAGIAAANFNNGEGIAGVAPGCRLQPIRRPSAAPELEYSDMYIWTAGFNPQSTKAGFPAAIANGADVITNSFGIYQLALSGLMQDTFDFLTTYGRGGRGCVILFSVGNNNCDFGNCPVQGGARQWALYNKTIAVSASRISPPDAAEVKVSTSNFGNGVDICAPSGGPGGGAETRTMSSSNVGGGSTAGTAAGVSLDYQSFGQTSCACPQVAGAAALILSVRPELNWVQVREILRNSATRIDLAQASAVGQWVDNDGDSIAEYSQWYGFGRLDVEAAVRTTRDTTDYSDIVIRDNLADDGTVPSGGWHAHSPDIWVRQDNAPIPVLAYNSNPPHENAKRGQNNYVFLRVRNFGLAASNEVYLRALIVHFPGFEFRYPQEWIPSNRPGQPVPNPLTTGTYLIGEQVIDDLAVGAERIVKLTWNNNLIPPETVVEAGVAVSWHPCILAEVSPHDGANPSASGHAVKDNNNLAHRNIRIDDSDDDSDSDDFAVAVVAGTSDQYDVQSVIIDRSSLPDDYDIFLRVRDAKIMDEWKRVIKEGTLVDSDLLPGSISKNENDSCNITLIDPARLSIECCKGKSTVIYAPAKTRITTRCKKSKKQKPRLSTGTYKGQEVILYKGGTDVIELPFRLPSNEYLPIVIGMIRSNGMRKQGLLKATQRKTNGELSPGYTIEG